MKGVPARIEIGEREVNGNIAVMVPRTERKKIKVEIQELPQKLNELLGEVKSILKDRALKHFSESQVRISELHALSNVKGFILAGWCGDKACSDKVEEKYGFETLGYNPAKNEETDCVVCGKPGKLGTFSKPY